MPRSIPIEIAVVSGSTTKRIARPSFKELRAAIRAIADLLMNKRAKPTLEIRSHFKRRSEKYIKANADRVSRIRKAATARRRARVLGSDEHYSAADVGRLYEEQKGRCAEPTCRRSIRKSYHADHIVPLSKGGSNAARNIQLLCAKCNLKKNNKTPEEWAKLRGRLF
jgi:5-methylcytosine-specific restriction endonuclease McrA